MVQVRRQVIDAAGRRIATAERAYRMDLTRAKNLEGHPIELLHSARLANAARLVYVRAVVGFNRAQFRLYVALGQQPPATPPPGISVNNP